MNRNSFLRGSAILGAASLLPVNSVFSQSLNETGMDTLTDKDGNFSLQPLPYTENFLEPAMDQETLHLHYTFHHGDAVKAANIDLANIKKAIDANTLDTVDYWTKKLSFHLSSHILHTIFWTNLTSKKGEPSGPLLRQIEKDFGSFDKLKLLITKTSKGVDGNGWGILGFQRYTRKLTVLQCENHEKLPQRPLCAFLRDLCVKKATQTHADVKLLNRKKYKTTEVTEECTQRSQRSQRCKVGV